jgi:hypothetical protein
VELGQLLSGEHGQNYGTTRQQTLVHVLTLLTEWLILLP